MTTEQKKSRQSRAKNVILNRIRIWTEGSKEAEALSSTCKNFTSFQDKLTIAEQELLNLRSKGF